MISTPILTLVVLAATILAAQARVGSPASNKPKKVTLATLKAGQWHEDVYGDKVYASRHDDGQWRGGKRKFVPAVEVASSPACSFEVKDGTIAADYIYSAEEIQKCLDVR